MADNPVDKRKYERHTSSGLVARLSVGQGQGAGTADCVVVVRDFSKGGASVYIGFKANALTPVQLTFEGVELAPLEGIVAWCTPVQNDPSNPKGATHRIGIDFRPKDRAAQENLAAAFAYISQFTVDQDDDDEDENEF